MSSKSYTVVCESCGNEEELRVAHGNVCCGRFMVKKEDGKKEKDPLQEAHEMEGHLLGKDTYN